MLLVITSLVLTLASALGITGAILVKAPFSLLLLLVGAYTVSAGLLLLSLTFEMSRSGLQSEDDFGEPR